MRWRRLVDPMGDPLLEVVFGYDRDELRAWVRIERLPASATAAALWATQELRPLDWWDWRLQGRVFWGERFGPLLKPPASIGDRPGIDQHLKRIGPAIERLRAYSDQTGDSAVDELVASIDLFCFGARSKRGIGSPFNLDVQAIYRQSKRAGRVTLHELTPEQERFFGWRLRSL